MTEARAMELLCRVFDPELGHSLVDLGMIYAVETEEGRVRVRYGLTAYGCPLAGELEGDMKSVLRGDEPGLEVELDLVLDPPWSPERMSEELRLELGYPV